MKNRRIAITGLGVVSPIGSSVEAFGASIRAGRGGVGPITRFDASRLDARIAAEVKDFDPEQYVDFKTARRMALFTQYAVGAAVQAWRDAGFEAEPPADLDRVAVILGNGIGGNEVDCEAHERLHSMGPRRIQAMTIPKLIINEAAGNVSMVLGTRGRAHTIGTACASGTDALGTALDLLRAGRADVIVAGGTESAITEYAIGGFCALKALSTGYNDRPEVASRPFDKDRDGFVMGEGAGVLILEPFERAQARGARIYAELAGYGGTADAFHLTAPDPEGDGACRAIRLALEDAGLKPEDVDYINAHGTSTPVNDPIETKAIKRALGDHAYAIKVSSTKGMTGHCIAGAGALEAVVCTLAIRDGFFPPTINLSVPDPECDLDYVPNAAVEGTIRTALSTSLGFGGHNGVLVIRDANA